MTDSFNNSYEAWGYNVIINSLHNEFVMTMMRIYDAADPDTASLPNLLSLLEDQAVLAQFEKETRAWCDEAFGERALWKTDDGRTRADG